MSSLIALDDPHRIPRVVPDAPWTGGLGMLGTQSGAPAPPAHPVPGPQNVTLAAAFGRTVFDDWYNRIHYTAVDFDLGALVGSTARSLVVWNAFFVPQQLLAITASNTAGITLTPEAPLAFDALQARTFTLSISVDGPPVVDGSYTFDWADARDTTVTVRGLRIVAWPVPPDWKRGIRETLAWKTDVQGGGSAAPHKRAVRAAPRRNISFDVVAWGKERRIADMVLADWTARTWAMPVWWDVQFLPGELAPGAAAVPCATAERDFAAGGLAMLWASVEQYEVVEVLTVEAGQIALRRPLLGAWGRGTRLYPCRTAQVASPGRAGMWTDDAGEYQLSFDLLEPSDWPAAWPGPLYRGQPVLEWRPDWGETPSHSHERDSELVDGGTGIPAIVDWQGVNLRAAGLRWALMGRSEAARFRSLLYAFKGRLNAAWVPTFQTDLLPVAPLAGGAINVQWCGYTRHGRGRLDRRDIRIELVDGTVHYRRVSDSVEVDADTERLTIDSDLPGETPVHRVRAISYMALSELAGDSVEWLHAVDDDGFNFGELSLRGVKHGY